MVLLVLNMFFTPQSQCGNMGKKIHWLSTGVLIALVMMSGCLGSVIESPASNSTSPDTEMTNSNESPQQNCTGNETVPQLEISNETLPSSVEGFDLTVNRTTAEKGERITFELTNTADKTQYTGTKERYIVQRQVQDGWETITLFQSPYSGYNATAIPHESGQGFTWSFRATAAGFSSGKYVVCDDLQPGEYRFVYAGDRELAVQFTISVDGGK